MNEVFLKSGSQVGLFYDVSEPEVVKDNSEPVEGENQDDKKDLLDDVAILLENVHDAPDGDDPTEDGDNCCYHNTCFV